VAAAVLVLARKNGATRHVAHAARTHRKTDSLALTPAEHCHEQSRTHPLNVKMLRNAQRHSGSALRRPPTFTVCVATAKRSEGMQTYRKWCRRPSEREKRIKFTFILV
jgi:hypothetical protein